MSRRKPESDGFGKLTLSVPEDLIYQAKVTATRVRTSLSHEVTEFLKRFVAENAEGGTPPSQEQPDPLTYEHGKKTGGDTIHEGTTTDANAPSDEG